MDELYHSSYSHIPLTLEILLQLLKFVIKNAK